MMELEFESAEPCKPLFPVMLSVMYPLAMTNQDLVSVCT